MSEWKTYKLGEIAVFKNGKTRPADKGVIPVYGGNGILDYTNVANSNGKVVIIGRVGAYCGSVFYEDKPIWVSDNAMYAQLKHDYNPKFVYYLLKNLNLNKYAQGSSHPLLTQTLLNDIEVNFVKDKSTQQSIASTLSSLDDKIELNLQMNQTLEAIAQAIFKKWFVNFNFPGFDGELVDGLPKGWRMGKLNEIANIEIGRTPPRMENEWFSTHLNDIKWISIKDLGQTGVYIFKTSEYLTQEAVERFRIPVIPENTVVLSFKLTIGRLAITTEKMLSNEAIAQIKSETFSPEFIYTYLKTYNWGSLGSTSSIATAINSKIIKEMEILIPERKIENQFQEVIKPFFEKLKINSQETELLTQLRDSLLPKLMTGKIKILV